MTQKPDHDEIYQAFKSAVNMTPASLAKWLESENSRAVGWKGADGKGSSESVGHKSGKRIIEIKQKKKTELSDDDYAHMAKVVAYVKRHLAQRPASDVETSRWRYSLMNWGHDPL
jgi:ribosomal protein L11